jgi:hypothetical protein
MSDMPEKTAHGLGCGNIHILPHNLKKCIKRINELSEYEVYGVASLVPSANVLVAV